MKNNKPLPDFVHLFTSIFFISGGVMLIQGIGESGEFWVDVVIWLMVGFMLIGGAGFAYSYDKLVRGDNNEK